MEKQIIDIFNIIEGNFAVTTVDGETLYEIIRKNIQDQHETTLDFARISIVTTAFLNAAIGQLYRIYKSEDIKPYLRLTNVDDEDLILFQKVTSRAKQYYAQKKN